MQFNTLNTIVADLLNIVRAADVTNIEPISERQIEDWVHQYRSLLIKRSLDSNDRPNPDYIQTIPAVRIEPIDLTSDILSTYNLSSDIYFYKTSLQIPKTIDFKNKSGITYVGTMLGKEIQLSPESRVAWQKYKTFTKKDPVCFLRDGYLYLSSSEPLEYIVIRGIFEVPTEVSRFINPRTNQPYFDKDSKYPIPINLIPSIKELVLTKELKIEASQPSDKNNNE